MARDQTTIAGRLELFAAQIENEEVGELAEIMTKLADQVEQLKKQLAELERDFQKSKHR